MAPMRYIHTSKAFFKLVNGAWAEERAGRMRA